MNTFRHDDEQRRQWVQDKAAKRKTVKQICSEAQISRATLYNWIDEFKEEQKEVSKGQLSEMQENTEKQWTVGSEQLVGRQEKAGEREVGEIRSHFTPLKTLPVHHAGTKHRMLLAALEKLDADKNLARKLAATLVKRFTLSIAQACDIAGIDEATYGYKPRKPEVDDRLVQQAIVQILLADGTKSFDQCCNDLLTANPGWTRKQIKRVYREGRLYLKRQRSRSQKSGPLFIHPYRPGACWNIGLLQNGENGVLFILDDADAILLNTETISGTVTGEVIIAFLNRAVEQNSKPRRLRVPGKQPFDVKELTGWAFKNKISLLTLSMAKPENELEVEAMETIVKEELKAVLV